MNKTHLTNAGKAVIAVLHQYPGEAATKNERAVDMSGSDPEQVWRRLDLSFQNGSDAPRDRTGEELPQSTL